MAWFSNIQSIIVYAYTNTQIHIYVQTHTKTPVSEMTYTVSSGTLNPSIPYHTIQRHYAKPTLLNQALCDYRPVVYNAKTQIYRTITDAH